MSSETVTMPQWEWGNDTPARRTFYFIYRRIPNGETEYLNDKRGRLRQWRSQEAVKRALRRINGETINPVVVSTPKSLSTVLKDDDPDFTRTLPIRVVGNGSSVSIFPEGYGDYGSAEGQGCPVFLELHQGKFRLVVFADINREDPTHIIDLQGAREVSRQDTELADEEERINAQIRD